MISVMFIACYQRLATLVLVNECKAQNLVQIDNMSSDKTRILIKTRFTRILKILESP